MSLNTTPSTATAGTTLAAAFWNAEVRDALIGIQAAWTTFTPTWGATTTNPTIGNGTLAGRWLRIGKTARIWYQITIGSTTTFGSGIWVLNTPAPMLNVRWGRATGDAFDSSASASFVIYAASQGNTTQVQLQAPAAAANAAVVGVSPTVPMTWATGDVLTIEIDVELA